MPSTTKFRLSNFDVEHAIVIFKHAIVQLKYEIQNGMFILLFNMKPLPGLFKANMHYDPMAFVFELSLCNCDNSELHPALTICNASFGMCSDTFLLRSS